MSNTNDIYDEIDLESILLPPLKTKTIKHAFKGWKSLALLHSWDDLKIFNTDFEQIVKYEKFKQNYKYICKHEKKLLSFVKDYQIAKTKALKRKQISKNKTLSNPKHVHSHSHKSHIPSAAVQTSKNHSPMPSKYYIKPIKQTEYAPFNHEYTNANNAYYAQYYHGHNTQMPYNNGYATHYNKPCNQYNNGYAHNNYGEYNNEITEYYVEHSPPNASYGISALLSESNNSCSTAISN